MRDIHGHPLIKKFCLNCRKEYFGRKSQTLCSRSCAGKKGIIHFHNIDRNGENNPNYRNGSWRDKNLKRKLDLDRHPLEMQARQETYNAIRRGEIKKEPCKVCGNPKAEVHHPDYEKPLDVLWLCKKHHLEIHRDLAKDLRCAQRLNPSDRTIR